MPKARFIERSPASFFMHRRCASFEKLDSNNATTLRNATALLSAIVSSRKHIAKRQGSLPKEFHRNSSPDASRCSVQGGTNKKSRRSRGCNPQPVCGMESSRSDACNQSEGKYMLLRDATPSQSDEFHTPYFAR